MKKQFQIIQGNDQASMLQAYYDVCEQIRELEAIKEQLRPKIIAMVNDDNKGAPIEAGGFRASVSNQTRETIAINKVRANAMVYEMLAPFINVSASTTLNVRPLKADENKDTTQKVSNA